jgi:hypothetical protein
LSTVDSKQHRVVTRLDRRIRLVEGLVLGGQGQHDVRGVLAVAAGEEGLDVDADGRELGQVVQQGRGDQLGAGVGDVPHKGVRDGGGVAPPPASCRPDRSWCGTAAALAGRVVIRITGPWPWRARRRPVQIGWSLALQVLCLEPVSVIDPK